MSPKIIPLTQGYSTLIDDEDFELVTQKNWHTLHAARGPRANTNIRWGTGYTGLTLGRFLMGLRPGDKRDVDHINRDPLDNRRSNLRIVTRAQNAKNRSIGRANTSGYMGVGWYKHYQNWRARITTDGKKVFLGYFESRESAARAYNNAAKKYHGEFASLNDIKEK